MFNSKHYIPILRWKAAEKEALGKLNILDKKFITPLIEIIMPQGDIFGPSRAPQELLKESIAKLQTLIPKQPEEIIKYWGESPAFIDLFLIDASLRVSGLTQLLTIGKRLGITLIPVINLNSKKEFLKKVCQLNQKYKNGMCLRLFRADLVDYSMLLKKINYLLKTYRLSEKNIDIIVDFQIVSSADQEYLKLDESIKKIPHLIKWKTFTCASGAFPPDLTEFSVDLHFIQRTDWNNWINHFCSKKLLRMPAFADYTIQHPIFKKIARGSNPSASIRYTIENQWMIMRGQGLRSPKGVGHAQYPAYAKILSERSEFFGSTFSYGDAYIKEIGRDIKTKKTGNPRTWLRAGINHHIACTVYQIANLS